MMGNLVVIRLIEFYRKWLSPLKPPCCRFTPSCSEYALEAFRVHGFFRALFLSVWRVMRCQPLYRGPLNDPVPSPRRRTAQMASNIKKTIVK